MKEVVKQLADWLESAQNACILSGAGISVPSGIPDFRSAAGIYSNPANRNVFDIELFRESPEYYYRFAQDFNARVERAVPNAAHILPARLEARSGHSIPVVTQNIDDLHERGGSRQVFHVHGRIETSTCLRCGRRVDSAELRDAISRGEVPRCTCRGFFKPDVTFFGEQLPEFDWANGVASIRRSDLVLVLGTSLQVHPAATLPSARNEKARLVIINRDPTPLDGEADAVLHTDLHETFVELGQMLELDLS